jgi:hypothetical protein
MFQTKGMSLFHKFSFHYAIGIASSILFFGCGSQSSDKTVHFETKNPYKCKSCPAISGQEDTLNFAREVMRFVATTCDYGIPKHPMCDTFLNIPIADFPVERFVQLFVHDSGVATCGLASRMMIRILLDNHIDAYTYNFGFKNTALTHELVLVKQNNRLLVFDPYLNYQLLNPDSSNASLTDVLLHVGNPAFVPIFLSDTVESDFVLDFGQIDTLGMRNSQPDSCVRWIDGFKHTRGTFHKMKVKRYFGSSLKSPCDTSSNRTGVVKQMEQYLNKKTLYSLFHQAMILKINKSIGAEDATSINAMIDTMVAQSVRHKP